MRSVVLLLICAVAPAQQFDSLAVTDDAVNMYFTTGQRLKSDQAPGNSHARAIHRLSNGVVERLTSPIFAAGWSEGDDNAQVSGDGVVFLYTHWYYCSGGSSCISRPTTATSALTVRGGTPISIPGAAQLSYDGRYVWSVVTVYGAPPTRLPDAYPLLDRQTGTTVSVPIGPASPRQAIARDGRVLGIADAKLTLWSPQSVQPLPTQKPATTAIVNDCATWVAYTTATELRSFEIATGRDTLLATGGRTPSISADGASLLYLADRQAWIARPDGAAVRQLTNLPEGIDLAVLSGSGHTAVATTGGRLVAIDVASGELRELIPRTPMCSVGFTALTPGSILPFRGSNMSTTAAVASPPLPPRLSETAVRMDGVELPLLSVAPSEIWFQVPFDTPVGARVSIGVENSSWFDGCNPARVDIVDRAPYFFTQGDLVAAHEDFQRLVTAESRARPGEVVTLWAVGLGSVTSPVPTGLPTPIGTLARLDKPFECRAGVLPISPPLELPFAGLAPGMIGVYQVSVRMPDHAPSSGSVFLSCGTPGSDTERHGGSIPMFLPAR